MIKRKLGRTGFEVTALGLGGYQFTGQFGVDPAVSEELIDYAMNSEINYFDTAMSYGFGESEEIVARGLAKHPDKQAVVSDKMGYYDCTVSKGAGNNAYIDPMEIKRCLKHSLWVFRRDHFDIMMIHEANWPQWQINYETGDCVAMEVLEELKKEGIVCNIGVGLWDLSVATKLIKTGRIDVILSAGGMNLLEKPIFDELIPAAREQNVGITLGGGFGQNNPLLAVKNREKLKELYASSDEKEVMTAKKLEKLYDISDELGCSMFELAIRYILAFEDIHCHVPGARMAQHLAWNIESAEKGPLDRTVVEAIDEIQKMGKSFSSQDFASRVDVVQKNARRRSAELLTKPN